MQPQKEMSLLLISLAPECQLHHPGWSQGQGLSEATGGELSV